MPKYYDQRVCLKFCYNNEISAAESIKMLQRAFGDEAMGKTAVYKWYEEFKEGRESIIDKTHPGHATTATDVVHVRKVEELVMENRRLTLRELADEVGISYGSCQTILKDKLQMQRVAARVVPKMLNFDQKNRHKEVAREMISEAASDWTFMQSIITGDETYVYQYDVETKQQSTEWRRKDEPRPKKPRQSQSKVKVLLTVFFDYRGVVHKEFLPTGQTVNKEYYLSVMQRLRESIRKNRPDLWKNNSWFLHHDNAPAHNSMLVRNFLAKNSTRIIPQAPYSPDMAPCDFFLFAKLKNPLRGHRFNTIDEIKQKSQNTNKPPQLKCVSFFYYLS
jgi:histone-lysine N-methyltransferase SETMAR